MSVILLLTTGCATSSMTLSERACEGGRLAAYADEDFSMRCQKIERMIYEGNTPQVIVKEPERVSNWGAGAYGRKVISRISK